MFTSRRLAIGVPLIVISGIAAELVFSSKTTGNMVAADWSDSSSSFIHVEPANTGDAQAYSIFWRGCTLQPDFDHRFCMFASGLVPRSAIRTQQVDAIGIDLDLSTLSVVFSKGLEDCRTGICSYYEPLTVPLHATFVIYTGSGSSVERSSGNTRTDHFFSVYPPVYPPALVMTSESFSGSKTRYTATLTGIVGPATVTAPVPPAFNAYVTTMSGQHSSQTVYPAAP